MYILSNPQDLTKGTKMYFMDITEDKLQEVQKKNLHQDLILLIFFPEVVQLQGNLGAPVFVRETRL